MNTTLNDRGEIVTAIGAPGSEMRAACEWPKLIEQIKNVYLACPTAQQQAECINGMMIKRRISGLERQSILSVAWKLAKATDENLSYLMRRQSDYLPGEKAISSLLDNQGS